MKFARDSEFDKKVGALHDRSLEKGDGYDMYEFFGCEFIKKWDLATVIKEIEKDIADCVDEDALEEKYLVA